MAMTNPLAWHCSMTLTLPTANIACGVDLQRSIMVFGLPSREA
jgi:hypothetical protein